MIRTVNKPCPGDCSRCTYPNEIPGFDMYGCALNQMLQRTIRMEQQVQELKETVELNTFHEEEGEEKIIINHTEEQEDETSDETLPEQEGAERVLDK